MSEPTIPGQLDTIIGVLSTVQSRLDVGDRRMNEADLARGQMNDKLDVHGLMMADQSKHLGEQDDKLDAISKTMGELGVAMKANTEITTIVRDAITTAKGSKTFLIWAAGIIGALGTIAGTVYTTLQLAHH